MLQMIAEIQSLIEEYDKNKGWRRLFSWFPWLGYHPDIRALQRIFDYSNKFKSPQFDWDVFFRVLKNRESDASHLSTRLLTSLIMKVFGNLDNVNSSLAQEKFVSHEVLKKLGHINGFRRHNRYPHVDDVGLYLKEAFTKLNKNGHLSEHTAIILMHPNPDSMFDAIKILSDEGIKTPENITYMLEHKFPSELAMAFAAFSRIGKLNEYRDILKKQNNLGDIVAAVDILKEANIQDDENIECLLSCKDYEADVASVLVTLSSSGHLSTENRKALIGSDSPPDIAGIIKMLAETNLLSSDIARQVITYKNSNVLHKAVYRLSLNAILSTETVTDVLAYELGDPGKLAQMYSLLSNANIFTDENRLAWRQVPDQLFPGLLDYIPPHQFTQNLNENLLIIVGHQDQTIDSRFFFLHMFIDAYRRVVEDQHIDPFTNTINYDNNLNYAQSKHKSCVEQSVSESAVRLNDLYGNDNFDEDKILSEMQSWIGTLDTTDMSSKAKPAFPRLRNRDYTNEGSQISTPRLLALTWCAIHDDERRIGILAEAKDKLVEALFDCQRSYNFDENDNHVAGGEDKNTCIAGEFLTSVIKMDGVHPAIKIIYITEKDDAEKIKLPAIVKKQAVAYLQEQQKSANETREKQLAFNKLISDFRTDGVGAIWEKIKSAVLEMFFGEYGALYNNGQNDQHLKALVDAQEYMPTKDTQGLLDKHNIAEVDVKEENAALQVTSSGVVTTGLFANSGDKAAGDLDEVREKRAAYFMSKK